MFGGRRSQWGTWGGCDRCAHGYITVESQVFAESAEGVTVSLWDEVGCKFPIRWRLKETGSLKDNRG